MSEPVLSAEGLVKTFRQGRGGPGRARISAVDDVSLDVHAGECLGVVGESGCGKSTVARMLVGLERPDSGDIRFRGQDVTRLRGAARRDVRRRVQMVFQDPYSSLNPRLPVLDLISEPLQVHGTVTGRRAQRDRVAELLEMVNLPVGILNRYPHQFSGGQRQRIGIARALALEPDVLVCDEPVSALDVSVQAQVVNLLRRLQQERGVALVFIAHDLAVVRHIADRTAVMYLGRLAELAPTPQLFERPSHPYTQALLSASPTMDRSRRGTSGHIALRGDPPSPANPPSGCRFRTRCRLADDICAEQRPSLLDRADTLAACHHADAARAEFEARPPAAV